MKRLITGLSLSLWFAAAPMGAVAQEVVVAPSAEADAAQRLELSNRFIVLMQADQMGAMIGQMTTSMTPNRPGMTAKEAAAFERAMTRASSEMMPRLFAAMAPIYADIFSLEELQALVAFYESDVGQSMVKKTLEAGPRMTEAMMAVMPETMSDMVDTMCNEMDCTPEQRAQIDAEMARSGMMKPAK